MCHTFPKKEKPRYTQQRILHSSNRLTGLTESCSCITVLIIWYLQILQTERDARNAESVAEKLALEKKVDELKRKKRRLRNELDDREEEVSQQRKSMITELEQRMVKQTEQQNLFVIRWKVKEN